jgi:DNA-binding beta-propeller fold protein YncE
MDLATHTVTTFTTTTLDVRGLAFDGNGNLFAMLNGTTNYIVKLDPVTGAVVGSLVTPAYGDGLTFDPFSGELWSAGGSGLLFAIKTDLSSLQQFSGPCFRWDGVVADGKGNIDIAGAGCNNMYQFNIASSTFTKLADTPGIDDLAPLVGLGAPPAVPEPSTLFLIVSGLSVPLRKLRSVVKR